MEKARLVLAEDVWRQIEWFTHNFDKEIGAFGVGRVRVEDGEKYFYVDKLVYPKQTVTGATVSIDHDGWHPIIQELGMQGMGKIMFYWHRHPGGSPHHSSTDEKDTFGTFMAPEAKRPYFVFLQTASSGGDTKFEGRIEIRNPVRATIPDSAIEIEYESAIDTELEDFCNSIIEDRVTTKTYTYNVKKTTITKSNYPSTANNSRKESSLVSLAEFFKMSENDKVENINTAIISDTRIPTEAFGHIYGKDGQINAILGNMYREAFRKAITENESFKSLIDNYTEENLGTTTRFALQPSTKAYKTLFVKTKQAIGRAVKKYLQLAEESGLETKVKQETDTDEYMHLPKSEAAWLVPYIEDILGDASLGAERKEGEYLVQSIYNDMNDKIGELLVDTDNEYYLKGAAVIEQTKYLLSVSDNY